MSSGKKLILQHFRKEDSRLTTIEEKISRLETATKQKLIEFSDSSKKAQLVVERAYDLSGVRTNLFESKLKYVPLNNQPSSFNSPRRKEEAKSQQQRQQQKPPKPATADYKARAEVDQLRKENNLLTSILYDSNVAKLEQQLQLLEAVERMQSALKQHTRRKLMARRAHE